MAVARPARAPGITTQVWDQVCRHCDGIAIGSTMAALAAHGGLAAIAARERQEAAELQQTLGARPGYLRVALRLLADQGWVRLCGNPRTGDLVIAPTPTGLQVFGRLGAAYARVPELLAMAAQLDGILSGSADAGTLHDAVRLLRARWDIPGAERRTGAAAQVAAHLDGHVIGPLLSVLSRRDVLRQGSAEYLVADILGRGDARALALAVEALRLQGWTACDSGTVRLTPAGRTALACVPQYWHPICYLPLIRSVPDLLFGGQPAQPAAPPDASAEEHQDRELDIRFSGQVFSRTCRDPFLDVVLPLFDLPLERQPSVVVDVGCGDGSLLAALYDAIRTRSRRGPLLGSHPLLLVGAEPSAVARTVAARRLGEAGVPNMVINGDITDPAGLAAALRQAGTDARDALYVCKSVIHDRPYADPGDVNVPGDASPGLLSTFAAPSGDAIPGDKVAASLVVLFQSWRTLAARHGFVVIEAHAADPVISASLLGRAMTTSLDATHGYSHQYLVTAEAFSWAAQAGGFTSRAHREPASGRGGYKPLTIDHFTVANGQ